MLYTLLRASLATDRKEYKTITSNVQRSHFNKYFLLFHPLQNGESTVGDNRRLKYFI
jgi:hypothetical protein